MDKINSGFDAYPEKLEKNQQLKDFPEDIGHKENCEQDLIVDLSDADIKVEKRRLAISIISFCLLVSLAASAYDALFNSQTSLLPTDGMGNTIFTISNGVTVFATALLIPYILQVVGIKRSITISMASFTLYTACFFYPRWELIIPAAVMSGIIFNLMFTSWFAYANKAAYWYSKLSGGDLSLTITFMMGITNMSANGGYLWGNLILYFIMNDGQDAGSSSNGTYSNLTSICGINYCNEDLYSSTNAKPPSQVRYYTLIGVFTGMSLLGTFGSLFISDIPHKLQKNQKKEKKTFRDFVVVLKEFWSVLIHPKGFLPVTVTFFLGLEGVFTATVFTQAFITCNLGVSKVGFFMFAYGIAEILASGSQWILIKVLGRPLLMITIYVMFMSCYIYLLLIPELHTLTYFIIAAVFGLGDATLTSTLFSIYGFLFPDATEGAFALVNVWWGLAVFVPFLLNQYLCVRIKIYILIVMGTIGFGVYLGLETMLRVKAKKQMQLNIQIATNS